MSVAVMAWAWKLRLGSPTRKVVLLKLADNANDSGQCFPSIPYIAHQCEIDERTVQRTIQALARDGYLHVERRFHNGHPSSNVYHLHCTQAGGGRLPPPPGTPPPPLPAPCRDGGGPVPPITTTTEPKEEEPSPQRGHRVSDSLAVPESISSAHRLKAHGLLSSLPAAQQQLVADEWAARLRRGSMRKPLAYLTTLVKRAAAGTFMPELADEERLRREAQQGRACQAEALPLSPRAAQVQQLVTDAVAHLRRN